MKNTYDLQSNNSSLHKIEMNGTSFPEQAIYYFVKLAFSKALNRCKIRFPNGSSYETDIYIPSLKIAIEYDGVYWHSNEEKRNNDIAKNRALNSIGILVIRVREVGLQALDNFYGITYFHGNSPEGKALHIIITEIMHFLAQYVNNVIFKSELLEFSLTEEDFYNFYPQIEAQIYKFAKTPNFTSHLLYRYWCPSLNAPLKAENIDSSSNVWAWFICPKGEYKLLNIRNLNDNDGEGEFSPNSILSICPFMPNTSTCCCGINCSYVNEPFRQIIINYLHADYDNFYLDAHSHNWLRYYPQVAFSIIREVVDGSKQIRQRFEETFVNKGINGVRTFITQYVELSDISDIDYYRRFQLMYPDIFVCFNWELFDQNNQTRQLLFSLFEELINFIPSYQYKICSLFSFRKRDPTNKMIAGITKLLGSNGIAKSIIINLFR